MKRAFGLMIGLAVLSGCQSASNEADSRVHENVDDMSIADAPTPSIKPATYVAAGDLAAARGQFQMAAKQYESAAKLDPKDPAVLKKLALAYVKSDQMQAAIDAWKRYSTATDGSAEAFGSLGYAYELAGNHTAAEQTYIAGVAKHPDGALVRVNYGLMLVRNNRVDEAVKQMSAVLQPYEVNYDIAGVYQQLGRRDLAQFYYRRSLECNPNFWAAKQRLATLE
ncbi:MAG: tetratricopeptide repeat protein [Tepidisphaeraceae bacterium]